MIRARREDWAERLLATVDAHQAAPFAWGRYDCATLFGACIEALTGQNPIAPFLPYDSERGAVRALLSTGSPDVTSWVATILPEIPPAAAGRGDFGYVGGHRLRLQFPAVILGAEALSRNETGLVRFPRALVTQAFSLS